MVEEKIKKIVDENNISDDAEIKPISMDGMVEIVLNILHSYSEDMVKSLNRQTNMIASTCSDKDEKEMLGSMVELVNVMLNKAIGEAVDSTMKNLGKFLGIDDLVISSKEDELEELKNMEKCDGEA